MIRVRCNLVFDLTSRQVDHISSCENNPKAMEFLARNFDPRQRLGCTEESYLVVATTCMIAEPIMARLQVLGPSTCLPPGSMWMFVIEPFRKITP